jgi:TonB family protein
VADRGLTLLLLLCFLAAPAAAQEAEPPSDPDAPADAPADEPEPAEEPPSDPDAPVEEPGDEPEPAEEPGDEPDPAAGPPEPAEPAPVDVLPPPDGLPRAFPIPDVLDAPAPVYPVEALEGAVEGTVVLLLHIDADGVVTDVDTVRSPNDQLAESAAAALRDTIFDSPPEEGPAHALRRYFHVVEFVLPDEYRPEEPEDEGPEPEMADELTQLPTLLKQVGADYPDAAREAGVQGQVTLELEVGDDGQMDAVTLLGEEPDGWGFGLAATSAAWQFTFEPAYAGEVPVPVRITYTYSFELEEVLIEVPVETPDAGAAIDPDGPVNVSGFVRERGSRKPLTGVDVIIEDLEHSTITDDFGYFAFHGIPAGTFRLLVAAPGYEKFETEEDVFPGQATEVVYFVRESPTGVNETIVRVKAEKKEVTKRSISIETIERIPGTFGDPVKVVQNLPGVARSPFDFGLLIVRGSAPEDSGAHIDGIRVPQLFHFGGFRSVLTPIMLESVDFYPGGFGPTYGRLMGGVLDVRTRNEYEDTIHGLVQMDLLDASAAITGPIKKKGERNPIGGFVIAARRSYLDLVLPLLAPSSVDLGGIILPQWTDLQGKLTLRPTPNHRVSVLAYWSQDRAGARSEDPASANNEATQGDFLFRNDFWRVGMAWKAKADERFRSDLNVSFGQDLARFDIGTFAKIDVDTFILQIREDAEIDLIPELTLRFGADIIVSWFGFNFDFQNFNVRGFGDDPTAEREAFNLQQRDVAFGPAAFVEGRFKLADERITLVPGFRFDGYTVPDNFEFATIDPRFQFRITPDPKKVLDLKGSVGIYHQNPQGFEIVEATGNTELQPEQSIQVTFGTEVRFTEFFSLDVQGFYKRLDQLVTFNPGGAGDRQALWQNNGEGNIYGAEVFLRLKQWNNLEGWISLTLQRSERQDCPDCDPYWFDFDQPVIFDAVLSYGLPYGFRVGARWRYVSGNPETPIVDSIYDSDTNNYVPLQGDENSDRLPDFHALDIRIDKDINFRRWKMTVYLDLMNVYNRQNPESRVHNFDYTENTFLVGLPILPNLGFKAQF